MHRIEGEQMGGGVGIAGRIIDVSQFDAGAPPQGREHQATNAPEAIDAAVHGEGSGSAGRRRAHRSTRVDWLGVLHPMACLSVSPRTCSLLPAP